ncbi:DUF3575 domain-containing protein [Allomuricauda sp. d1]|uniref:DUF3575 domain-containing protein n=1 Tax=Allomuricauda sp. d1 TaxID=3136725 RepID=UPI0031D74E7B
MKPIKIILPILLLASFSMKSQQNTADVEQKNHIMLNPFALAFGTIQVQYERALNEDMSLGLSVGAKISSGIFETPGFNTLTVVTNDITFSGVQISPEFRWYLQETQRSHTGFFVGAYYRYQNYKDDLLGTYTSSITLEDTPLDIRTSVITNSIGLEVGYKLPIKKHFYIDFLIAGPGIGFNKVKIEERQALPIEFFAVDAALAIIEEYRVLDALGTDIEFNDKGEATFTTPAFHYGIRIGYSF